MTNTKQMETIYESAADTAKKIRKALRVTFPGVKFSVRSSTYSMGSSVNVHWVDAPITEQVEAVVNQFKSGSFNGMEDIYESTGYVYEGKRYNGAKYIFAKRELSEEYSNTIQSYLEANFSKEVHNDWYWFNKAEVAMIKANQVEVSEVVETVNEVASVEVVNVEKDQDVTVSMNINEDKNGIELSFTGIPSKATRELIKENGFKWSAFKKVWYTKKSDSALLFTEAFVSAYNDVTPIEEVTEVVDVEVIETVVNEVINESNETEEIYVTDSALIGRKVLGSWGVMAGFNYGIITGETIYNEVIVKWDDNEDDLTESYYDIKDLKNNDTIDCIGIHLLPIEEVEPIPTNQKHSAKVLDFSSKFKQRQEVNEAKEMQAHFLNNVLPYMDSEDKNKLLEAAKDTDKFNELFQDILIKVSFKQALQDVQKS